MRILFYLLAFFPISLLAQTNTLVTHPEADVVLKGNYTPTDYSASTVISHPDSLVQRIQQGVSPDSLKILLFEMVAFQNRNTGSDTLSPTRGIGAARRWVYQYFADLSARREGRLLPAYLQFDRSICGMGQHRNIFSVLPGTDPSAPILILEGHIDSRCSDVCGVNCLAEGAEDNASGTALVMELARVMSQFTFRNTVVFLVTIGEEQGLLGADAFSRYCMDNQIAIKAVLNNDVIGGIICGATSSPPSCPGLNLVDSTQVRLFSEGGFNSPHKGLSRYIKLQYEEELKPLVQVPMLLTLMSAEDRTGRGGDHIPFREDGFTAMRFTSAHEHGDASNDPGYTDRQHSSSDILGIDTDGDQVVDSLFVNLNYLARNARINATAAAMLAIGPEPPLDFVVRDAGPGKLVVGIADPGQTRRYRVGVRTQDHDWDSVYTYAGILVDTLDVNLSGNYMVSVALYDSNGVESLFTEEKMYAIATGLATPPPDRGYRLLQNRPNPFDEATTLTVWVDQPPRYQEAWIEITDLQGRRLARLPVNLAPGANEVLYTHGFHAAGILSYTLVLDGLAVESKKMLFAF